VRVRTTQRLDLGHLTRRSYAVVAMVVGLLAFHVRPAHAERPVRGSIGGGATTLLTGAGGDHLRYDLALDLKPASRYGALLAWRAFDGEHRGLLTAGLVYEAAAARPRLVLDLHADLGADLDRSTPLLGGGVRATVSLMGPLGVALDGGAFLVLDGVDDTHVQLQTTARLVVSW
jgi:hypothetical protein